MNLLDFKDKIQISYNENKIDIDENKIYHSNPELLLILLKDRTTKKNLIWATDSYKNYGEYYKKENQIKVELITGYNKWLIKPRIEKNKKQQQQRSKEKAEVFTPSWVCNKQNNLIDNAWFERENSFNIEVEKSWETNLKKIEFPPKKSWQDYVKLNRLEITCGEAPYITSRYDTTSGEYIEVSNRIGLLDRKLRIISENIEDKKQWIEWSLIALKSIYAYDYQGDNVLLARENILYTVKEFYEDKFKRDLNKENLKKMANIISWNVWQMDGIKFVIPESCKNEKKIEYLLFGEKITEEKCKGCQTGNNLQHNGIYVKIKDWEKNKVVRFIDLLEG
ncbi:restriction endonuclease subunit M [Cetobacterium somerae]|uniref:restriction endonuclease subunit M n=1 Tax=Cetobacterium somerae TaxID=188913 RepID=UPI0038923160